MAFSNILGFSQSISAFSMNASFITHVPSINRKPSSLLPQEGSWKKKQTKRAYAWESEILWHTISSLVPRRECETRQGFQSFEESSVILRGLPGVLPGGSSWCTVATAHFPILADLRRPLELRLTPFPKEPNSDVSFCQFEWVSQGLQSLVLRAAVFLQVLS